MYYIQADGPKKAAGFDPVLPPRPSSLRFRIIAKVNESVGQDEKSKLSIGVLDIYGFEHFETNR